MAAYVCLNCSDIESVCQCSDEDQQLFAMNDMPAEIRKLQSRVRKLEAQVDFWTSSKVAQENSDLKAQLAAQQSGEPVAWLHVMDNTDGIPDNGNGIRALTEDAEHPFGEPGIDYSECYPVTSRALVFATPQSLPEVKG